MRDKVKRFISILMTALMLVNLLPVGALAEGVTISNSVQSRAQKPDVDDTHIYVYAQVPDATDEQKSQWNLNALGYYTIGSKSVDGMPKITNENFRDYYKKGISDSEFNRSPSEDVKGLSLNTQNMSIPLNKIESAVYKLEDKANDFVVEHAYAWHLDLIIRAKDIEVSYTVYHIGRNGETNTTLKTETLYGQAGTQTAAKAAEFEGYNLVSEIEQEEIKSDGTTKIYIYYEPDDTEVSVIYEADKGGTIEFGGEYKIQPVTGNISNSNGERLPIPIPTADAGYEFVGWKRNDGPTYSDLSDVYSKLKQRTVNAGKYEYTLYQDTKFTAKFKKNNYPYAVHYYLNGTTDTVSGLKDETGTAAYGSSLERSPLAAEGYTPVSSDSKTITIGADSTKNVINFYYYKNVTLTANGDTVTYNGQEQSVSGFTGAPEGVTFEGITEPSASGTDVGSYEANFVQNKDNPGYPLNKVDKTEKYIVTKAINGSLTITPAEVTLTANSDTLPYNGEAQSVSGFTGAPEGSDFSNITVGATGTDVGEYPANFADGTVGTKDKTGNYVVNEVRNGKLTITPAEVTLTANSDTLSYNGEAQSVSGFTGAPEGSDFSNITVGATGTDVGEYPAEFADDTVGKRDTTGNYIVKEANPGKLTITPVTDKVTVTITEHSDTVKYDGTEHKVTGYDVTDISNKLYTANDFTFSGNAEAKGTDAGTYDMELKPENFANINTNFAEVKFVIVDGKLKINKRSVKLTSETASKPYDGTPLTKPEVAVVGDGFVVGEVTDVKATGSVTNVSEGEVTNAITFTEGENFKADNYAIEKDEGKLSISKRSVMLTSADLKKVYDGTPLTNGDAPVTEMSGTEKAFPEGEGLDYTFTGSQTDVGKSENKFTFKVNEGTNEKNYSFEVAFGKLEVTPVTEEVIVTITGRTDEMPYDGKEHSVFGYDLTVSNALYNPKEDMQFNGIDADMTAKGTDAGTYPMKLTAEDFTNKSKNFSKVTFVVTDGYVKINPRAVTLTSETAGKTYDGTALEKPVVTVGGDGFVEGQVKEIKATGSVTNAGSVANTITFTPNKETFKDGNYAITKNEGTLTIAKRSVLITSQSATKTYDGSALTSPAVTITGDGFVSGELAKAEATGSITDVGSTPNAIQYTTTGAFNAANYSIALSVGTLTVTEKPQPEPRRTFNLTVNYVYQNGKRAAASYNRGGLKNGETFDITSPVIAGYTASETVVSGTIYNRDIKVTVIYTADGVNLDDYGVPLGLGNITMNVGDCFE